MDGWKTKLAMWRESMPENRFRPAGLVSLEVKSTDLASWGRKTPFEKSEKSISLLSSWELSMTREFAADDVMREWLAGLCDTVTNDDAERVTTSGAMATDPQAAPLTWALESEMPDGTAKRYSGLALRKWEIIIQSRRVIMEELTFCALKMEDIGSVTGAVRNPHMPTPARLASNLVDDSLPDVVSPAWPGGAGSRVFSSQIIFERRLEPCNYRSRGDAENFSCGAWEITGQNICRLLPQQFTAATGQDVEAALFWQVMHPALSGCGFNLAIPAAMIRVRKQQQVAPDIEHSMDFHAMNSIGTAAYLSTKS